MNAKYFTDFWALALACTALLTLTLTGGPPAARAQETAPTHGRYSATAHTGAAASTGARAVAGRVAAERRENWWADALIVLTPTDYLWWGGLAVLFLVFWLLSFLLAPLFYEEGRPLSAHSASRWGVLWAALLCCLLPIPLYFFTSWYWLDYWFWGGIWLAVALVLLVAALSHPKPAGI